ncbi:MAG: hypothetical protein CMA86_03615 [Euryarchaeota archaeon]|nr:hypothetical protein [Euryarchaeota archaeon]
MGVPLLLGELPINGRRPRKEEFNPFAKDASQQHRRRREDRERKAARRPPPVNETTPSQPADIQADLERKQREAMKKLEQKGDVSAQPVAPAPLPAEVPRAKEQSKPASVTREDRLAELRRKSEELKANAPSTEAHAEPSVQPETDAVEGDVEELVVEFDSDDDTVALPEKAQKRVKNVFKQIETKIAPKQDRRRRRRIDKKGGGRQKQEKKLNRQKYLEYKYAARDILDNPNVPEEHRSNILGQVWAKGERLGIDDSLEFIEQKEAELVLPAEVAEELRTLVKSMTTRR